MTEIVLFDPAHCMGVVAHTSQTHYQQMLDTPAIFREAWGQTYSAFDGDELIAIGGATLADGVSGGWDLCTNKITPKCFIAIHRAVARGLEYSRQSNDLVFAHVDPNAPQAVRWAELLGLEPRRTDIFPDGRKMLRVDSHVH